jgi:hypothetical protein
MGEPVDIANGCLFLASDESRYMTGAELVIDGGFTARRARPRPAAASHGRSLGFAGIPSRGRVEPLIAAPAGAWPTHDTIA